MNSVRGDSLGRSRKPRVLIAAYDVSTGSSSEGHVAFNLLRILSATYSIVLVTRKNNKEQLQADAKFASSCPGIRVIGFDLPAWARWWKRGARFYQVYAYLWQMCWPSVLRDHHRLRRSLRLVHVLNFHNDSIPSLAWRLGIPLVWGPINHHELVAPWRREFWPITTRVKHRTTFAARKLLWRLDPFLKLHASRSNVILSAGTWVDRRLRLTEKANVVRRSQLGVSNEIFVIRDRTTNTQTGQRELIYTGRLDWIKGVDLAIAALSLLPSEYCLRVVGTGPAERQLRSLAKSLGVAGRVQFQPAVPRNTLPSLYAAADLYLFTSAEVAGLVWVEALASGLPVIAFDGETEVASAAARLPGISLVKSSGNRSENIQALAQAVLRASLEAPRDRSSLRTAALQAYGWDAVASSIHEAYRAAIGNVQ